jgi:hypothetical protein
VTLQTRVRLAGLSIFYRDLHRKPTILYRVLYRQAKCASAVRPTQPAGDHWRSAHASLLKLRHRGWNNGYLLVDELLPVSNGLRRHRIHKPL